ncbi:SMODS domain-containing nucleotidyltransferase [Methylocystis rosea]|uniref:Nucleotidyltransferase n=1 Tax=Methylocystis rosea TaxID=173366 RepID=A0A3G8M311_9HYPH|nr:nucleotidyltransferase [Methylocystis rosea]AZG76316.1 nucleotidyltransferase [Methylocystis rosea]
MSVLSYLEKRASDAVLSSDEKSSISTSITTLKTRLNVHFSSKVSEHFQFGSSTRGTILPRAMDAHSDIDYMIVFSERGYAPQTYLDRLKRFVETYYSRSEIYQSSPTVVLELNHIRFDLVPALSTGWGSYDIPSGLNNWQSTNPNDFNSTLENSNKNNSYLIKPTIRLAKFWNAKNDYVFESFSFEKWILNQYFYGCANQRDYLFSAFDALSATSPSEQWRRDKIERAKKIVAEVRQLERDNKPYSAESEVKRLIPE